jgi:hypothetical protein
LRIYIPWRFLEERGLTQAAAAELLSGARAVDATVRRELRKIGRNEPCLRIRAQVQAVLRSRW